jgi:hypothetical protein
MVGLPPYPRKVGAKPLSMYHVEKLRVPNMMVRSDMEFRFNLSDFQVRERR